MCGFRKASLSRGLLVFTASFRILFSSLGGFIQKSPRAKALGFFKRPFPLPELITIPAHPHSPPPTHPRPIHMPHLLPLFRVCLWFACAHVWGYMSPVYVRRPQEGAEEGTGHPVLSLYLIPIRQVFLTEPGAKLEASNPPVLVPYPPALELRENWGFELRFSHWYNHNSHSLIHLPSPSLTHSPAPSPTPDSNNTWRVMVILSQ